jgi:RNA polymerase sigma-70 factor (ECF subfamily)
MSAAESPAIPDSALVDQALTGGYAAFEELISRYQKGIYNVAYYKSRNYFDAEDLSQEIFLAAFKALGSLKDTNNFGGWLYGIAYNRCHKWFQRERTKVVKFKEVCRRAEQEQRIGSGQPSASLDGEDPEVSEFLSRLPDDVRTALQMKYLDGKSYQEIGERLGIKSHRIDYLIRKGKRMIRERWEQRRASGDGSGAPSARANSRDG